MSRTTSTPRATGACLCGAVRYRVTGPLRDVHVCHCGVCRRTHGGPAAYSACDREHLELVDDGGLRWHEHDGARRGFCGACGGRLFWSRADRPTISITAGSLDEPTGLRVVQHIYLDSAGDWDERHEEGQ
ncbi:MAG: GFA family protein [Gaiellales bacterium]